MLGWTAWPPTMTDGPYERVERTAVLLRDAATRGPVELPTLTAEQLAALGTLEAAPWRDGDELSWWRGMGDQTRTAVTVAAVRGLGARGLLDLDVAHPEDGAQRVEMPTAPELSLLVSIRNTPAFIVVGGEPVEGQRGRLLLYGLVEENGAPFCVLTEMVDGTGLHHFRISAHDQALQHLAAWACAPAMVEDEGSEPATVMRTVEVIRRGDEGPIMNRMIVIGGTMGVAMAEVDDEGHTGDLLAITEDELRGWIEHLLREEPAGT